MSESLFIKNVNRHLLQDVYFEKMANPWRSGTADVWYSGKKGDLWVEYKYIRAIPKKTPILPDLSPRQVKWLHDRTQEGRNVLVIVGCSAGGVVWPTASREAMTPADFQKRLLSRKGLADHIRFITGESPCRSTVVCTSQSESSP